MTASLQWSASQIAEKIRLQEITVVDVVEAHINRIERVNPLINAVITSLFEDARAQATSADDHIATHGTDNLPPLFGVPITIKDCWAVEGVRFTGGSWYQRDTIADFDAETVKRLKSAGAIILGKTNLPDMCWDGESTNPIFGRTNNPHNINYSAGGSSGGEGAIIAAGGSPLGLGSDIAGSVRIPAAMNGCVALKPSANRVPSNDHVPAVGKELSGWNTAGPMARRVEDLALALSILSDTLVQDYTDLSLIDRPCHVTLKSPLIYPRSDVAEALGMATGALKKAGMAVTREDIALHEIGLTYLALMHKYGNPDFKKALGGGEQYSLWQEIKRHFRGEKRISAGVLYFTLSVDVVGKLASLVGYASFDRLQTMRNQLSDIIGEGGVLVTPLLSTAPPKHGWTWSLATQVPYTLMFNALGFPAVVLPIRYNEKNLPLAVQIVARHGEDEVALAVAAELERVYGGWQMAKVNN